MKKYMKFWGKADQASGQWHPLVCHMLDVAAVARSFCKMNPGFIDEWSGRFQVVKNDLLDIISFFSAIHDLGKFSSDFQCKVPELSMLLQGIDAAAVSGKAHPTSAWILWDSYLSEYFLGIISSAIISSEKRSLKRLIKPLLSASFGHHGGPTDKSDNDDSPFIVEKLYGNVRIEAARDLIRDLIELFPGIVSFFKNITENSGCFFLKGFSFPLSGLIVLSDWTASDSVNFPHKMKAFTDDQVRSSIGSIDQYYAEACTQAKDALRRQGLIFCNIASFNNPWIDIFPEFHQKGFQPSPLQQSVLDMPLPDDPSLYIIEDIAGSGKTEAALMLTARLLQNGSASGLYFALPTMATSNGMYNRMGKIWRHFFSSGSKPSLILAHGASGLHDEFQHSLVPDMSKFMNNEIHEEHRNDSDGFYETSSAACSEWIADRSRKVFLAQVGVGSIDQALLSVLYSKHNTLRMFGLSRQILIVDEVHAYDTYMQEILNNLLEFLGSQQRSVLLLSATLPNCIKLKLADSYRNGLHGHDDCVDDDIIDDRNSHHYPLITRVAKNDILSIPVSARRDTVREVQLVFNSDESIEAIIKHLKTVTESGRCAVWIRNTVRDVQNGYNALAQRMSEENVSIFHSRYAMGHRQNIESNVLDRFGKDSGSTERKGKILVASQVVEQSLDLDFDVMVTDLCPIDLVIQRAGRLMRHNRDAEGNPVDSSDQRGEPALWIYGPNPEEEVHKDWYSRIFRGGSYVYDDPAVLWRTAKVLYEEGSIKIPSRLRSLVEQVYGESEFSIPEELLKATGKAKEKSNRHRATAKDNLFPLDKGYVRPDSTRPWEDTRAPTRLSSESQSYRLCLVNDNQLAPLVPDKKYPWQMSEVRYKPLVFEYSPEIQKMIDSTNRRLFDRGRGGILLPVEEQGEGNYQTVGSLEDGRRLYYSNLFGLHENPTEIGDVE